MKCKHLLLASAIVFINHSLIAQVSWLHFGNNLTAATSIGSNNNFAMNFKTNNVFHGTLTATGLWGFGTQTPSTKVHVNSAAGQNPFRVQVNGLSKLYVDNGGGVSVGSSAIPPLNGLFVSGSLGVGTSAPANKLHVRQVIANKAIEWQHQSQTDNWTVGIGTSTLNCRFEFNGVLRGQISSVDGSFIPGSDLRLKQDIEPLSPLVDKIMQLQPSSYYFKDSRHMAKNKSIGFIAQDVEKVFPEMVYDFDGGYKGLNYSAFAVVAIKAIQEQQENINDQKKLVLDQQETITSLQDRIGKLEAALNAITGSNTMEFSGVSLAQNSPNPFRETTTLRYTVPRGVQAQLKIYDVSGKLVKSMNAPASGQANISGREFKAGTYIYTLLVNGKAVSSKKMVLLK